MAKKSIVLTGDKRLNQKLRQLETKVAKSIVRKAARPALKPVLAASRRNAPHDEGNLERSLTIRAARRSRSSFGARVTTREGMFAGKEFYGGFQEWGWKTGSRRSSSRRKVEGTHFLLRSAIEKRRTALTIYAAHIKAAMEAFARI